MFEVKDKEPEKIDPDQLEAYFMARFSLARLYLFLEEDKEKRVEGREVKIPIHSTQVNLSYFWRIYCNLGLG
jgi:hypothetical protein